MKSLYTSEVKRELRHTNGLNDAITENDIALLPEAIQRYFRHCGYIGKEKMNNAEIEWKDVFYKNSPKKRWLPLKCYQFNSVSEPSRIVYMASRLMGIFPFEGRDKYQDGHGNILIKILKVFQVVNVKGKEMDESTLATLLAEALIVPTYAFQPYITWTTVDFNTARAVIKHNKSEVSGIFYISDFGEFVRFETDDRYYSERGAKYKKTNGR